MKRQVRLLLIAAALTFVPYIQAQEPARPAAESRAAENKAEETGPGMGWKLANFALLLLILGYMIKKNAGKFFDARNEQIQRSLREAAQAKRQAEAAVADIERRLASLAGEIDSMRENARREIAAEGDRLKGEAERHVKRIQEDAQQEIENMVKAARRELKMHSAALAIKMAEEQMQGRITRDVENKLVDSFIADLRTQPGGHSNN